jgi:hypothetical protein
MNPPTTTPDRDSANVVSTLDSVNRKVQMNDTPRSNKLGSRGSGASILLREIYRLTEFTVTRCELDENVHGLNGPRRLRDSGFPEAPEAFIDHMDEHSMR